MYFSSEFLQFVFQQTQEIPTKKQEIFEENCRSIIDKYQRAIDEYSTELSDQAMHVTQRVVNEQNKLRKRLLASIKISLSAQVLARIRWQRIVDDLSHERASCYSEHIYPMSWELDPTEGPMRVRKRLRRCSLAVNQRFLLEDERWKLNESRSKKPLSYLFETQTSDSEALIYQLHTNEKLSLTTRCLHVQPAREVNGELLLGEKSLYFIGDNVQSITLPFDGIKSVLKRRHALRDVALEVFLIDGTTCLFAMSSSGERDEVAINLLKNELPNLATIENIEHIQKMWNEREITNFEYLIHLNTLSGRSYNDLMQYFVFPFVLSNYEDETLDLKNSKNYRILAKPISVQFKECEAKYLQTYKYLEKQYEEINHSSSKFEDEAFRPKPHHYGSHYSNSGTVLHFLVRLPPFTQMFLEYQDNNFDLPDRTFHSMATSWRLSASDSTTDFKELIPEFFFLSEFLMNKEGFNFGVRQNGTSVSSVALPDWCQNNSRYFILILRQALESNFVSSTISNWIDLVFGYKQTGRAAVEAINVFHPMTYYGVNFESIEDTMKRIAVQTMIKTYGQTPKQLFMSPHVSPKIPNDSIAVIDPPPVLPGVLGIKWGKYVGSPEYPPPVEIWRKLYEIPVENLVASVTGQVFGLEKYSSLVTKYSKKEKTKEELWAALVLWNNVDSVLRIKKKRKLPPVNLVQWQLSGARPTCCAAVHPCRLLLFGTDTGIICIFKTR